MKVNVGLLLRLRADHSWSQEEMALGSGLSLRTIQRIEKEGSASLQSMKALASALDIDIRDLELKEESMANELVGKDVQLHLGSNKDWNTPLKGKVLAARDDAWIELAGKKGSEFVNLAMVSRIVIVN